jgi:hypothetical protein
VRVRDLPTAYLNRQSLLGEHRELHGIYSIITANKSGHATPDDLTLARKSLSQLLTGTQELARQARV